VTEVSSALPETHILGRGNLQMKGIKVTPGFPECLGGGTAPTKDPRRLALARWMVSSQNPLTARVMVNRIWQGHFGRGIVRTPSDYGLQGASPTHPELLDYLASEFVRNKWSMKAMHRLIVMSNTYKQSSRSNAVALKTDPSNDLFWRFDMRRLTAEEVRDSLLFVSGQLNPMLYGPSVYPDIQKEVMAGQSIPGYGWNAKDMKPEDKNRRSVYIHAKRSLLYPLLEAFDVAPTDRTAAMRFATVQPTQALSLLNGAFANTQALALFARVNREKGTDDTAFVRRVYEIVLQRAPSSEEVQRGLDLLTQLEKRHIGRKKSHTYFCLAVLNLNEFLYLD
jgi:hypothetical protein